MVDAVPRQTPATTRAVRPPVAKERGGNDWAGRIEVPTVVGIRPKPRRPGEPPQEMGRRSLDPAKTVMKRHHLVVAGVLSTAIAASAGCSGGRSESARAQHAGHAGAVPAPAGSYSTDFDRTENPISEGGTWRRANNRWTNVRTSNGVAYGTNGLTNTYDDSYALLTGSYGADQTIEAVVYRRPFLSPGRTHEVELLLRFSDDEGNARGYECLFNWAGEIQIVRWNGALGDFTPLAVTQGGSLGRILLTGDVIKATIVGHVISSYINGVLMGRASDSTFSAGQPGVAFFVNRGGNPEILGITKYTVTSKW